MKKIIILLLITIVIVTISCKKAFIKDDPQHSATAVFNYLWNEVNNKYAYIDYNGLNWDAIKIKCQSQVYDGMSKENLFKVCGNMLNELKDGHVNLFSSFDISNYYPLFLNSPVNYDSRLAFQRYMYRNPANMQTTGPFDNTIIDTLGIKIGYIRYGSFADNIDGNDIDYVINKMKDCDGIVIDVRGNGGGSSANVYKLAGRFTTTKTHVFTTYAKIGNGKNDFDNGTPLYVYPLGNFQYTKQVAVLINRDCYSATSHFALAMGNFSNVRLIGDITGGGLGIPNGGQLPNGWTYRISVSKTISVSGKNYEDGVPPQLLQWMDVTQQQQGYDSIIERAFTYIKTGM